MSASLLAVSGLKVTRKNRTFTAEWTKPSTSKNSLEKIIVEWYYDKGNSNGSNWKKFKSVTLSKTASRSTLTLSKMNTKSHPDYGDFYPYTSASKAGNDATARANATLNKVKVVVKSVKGTKTKSASKTYDFTAPPKPSVSISWNESDKVSASWNIDEEHKIASDGKNPLSRVACRVIFQKEGSSTPGKKKDWAWYAAIDSGKSNAVWDGSPERGVKYTIEAYCAGPGGRSATASKSIVIATPNVPAVTSVFKSGSRYRVNFDTRETPWHPVDDDGVRLQYQDVAHGAQVVESEWEDALDAGLGGGNGSALTKALDDLAEGFDRYFRVTSQYRQIAPVPSAPYLGERGRCMTPVESASAIAVGLEGDSPYVSWALRDGLPSCYRVFVFRDDAATEITPGNEGLAQDDTDIHDAGVLVKDASGVRYGLAAGMSFSQMSEIVWSNKVPSIPTNLVATPSDDYDNALLTWTNPKGEFDGVEVAWSEHRDAWMSNEQPDTQTFDNPSMQSARIYGLETGLSYWFYVRTFDKRGDEVVYSPWAATSVACSMSSVPDVPVITPQRSWVRAGTPGVHATWSYSAESNEDLAATSIRLVSDDGIARVWEFADSRTEADLDLDGIEAGRYEMVAMVANASGSSASASSAFSIIEAPAVSLAALEGGLTERFLDLSHGYELASGEEDPGAASYAALTSMPIRLTCEASSVSTSMTLSIFAIDSYTYENPEGSETVFAGKSVFSSAVDSGELVVTQDMLDVPLVDGCRYRAQLTGVEQTSLMRSEDGAYGSYIDFTVEWETKAQAPSASVTLAASDDGRIYASISPCASSEIEVLDVYRVTSDGVSPVAVGVASGSEVTDAFPPYGWDGCAYRVAARTAEGSVEWADFAYSLEGRCATIDWGAKRLELPYNLEVGDNRQKVFEVRRHLSGSKSSYFAQGVDRAQSIDSVLVRGRCDDQLGLLYELSRYEGACMVRLPGGIAYAGTVDVSIDTSAKSSRIDVSLDVTETDDIEGFMFDSEG